MRLKRPAVIQVFIYDANGNLKSEGADIFYGYNGNDRIVTSTIEGTGHTCVYDADNRRVSVGNLMI